MAEGASAHQDAAASREETSQQRAVRTRGTTTDPQRAQQGATAAASAAPTALDSLSRLQHLADASPRVAQLRRLQALADGRFAPVAQLAGGPGEEELVQGKFATAELQPQLQQAPRANNTGLPDQLKSGIESLSGLLMDNVRVHFNSSQPARVNALAYAQGSDIHLAPGQERHLPHEAWHVVQQAQGRVRPTLQMKDGVQVNDDVGLEREADVMGAKALESGHRLVEAHHSISMPIETAQPIESDVTNSPDVNVANNHSVALTNGPGLAQRGGNEMQRIADQRPEVALQRQVQAWGDGSERVGQLRAWQGVADRRGVGGKRQDLTPGFATVGVVQPKQSIESDPIDDRQLEGSAGFDDRSLLQRKLSPDYSGPPGKTDKYFCSLLGSYVYVKRELNGPLGARWLLLERTHGEFNEQFIYQPEMKGVLPETFTRWTNLDGYEQLLTEVEERFRDEEYRSSKDSQAFEHPLKNTTVKEIRDALEKGLALDWNKSRAASLATRIATTFQILLNYLGNPIQPTPDLHRNINETVKGCLAKKDSEVKQASEALSELEHAANVVVNSQTVGEFVLGAQGPVWSPGMKDPVKPEDQHGKLPPLDVLRLEADAYYMTGGDTLHIDEVKDTPRALADKIKKGEQLRRQIKWLKEPASFDKSPYTYKKQVGYFVQAGQPHFDHVLSEAVLENFALLNQNQESELPFIRIGKYAFYVKDLEKLYKDAIKWLGDNSKAYKEPPYNMMKASEAVSYFFGDVEQATATIKKGDLPWK
jgi:hypothetical protein